MVDAVASLQKPLIDDPTAAAAPEHAFALSKEEAVFRAPRSGRIASIDVRGKKETMKGGSDRSNPEILVTHSLTHSPTHFYNQSLHRSIDRSMNVRVVMQTKEVGLSSVSLGAGRQSVDDTVDPAAGFRLHVKLGDAVTEGQPILTGYSEVRPPIRHSPSHSLKLKLLSVVERYSSPRSLFPP